MIGGRSLDYADIGYRDVTSEGLLRANSFKQLLAEQ